jgi:hypothetical protein
VELELGKFTYAECRPDESLSQLRPRALDNRKRISDRSNPVLHRSRPVADLIANSTPADVGTVAYTNVWEGRCHRLSGLGHAPFWEAPGDFDPVLERFLQDAETGRATTCHKD